MSIYDKEHCMWYGQYILMPQIKQMPYEMKKCIWETLFDEILFKDAFPSIISYNLANKDKIEIMKNEYCQSRHMENPCIDCVNDKGCVTCTNYDQRQTLIKD